MARGEKNEHDDSGGLLFDDNEDETGDTAAIEPEGGEELEDLRYNGPINVDDADDVDEEPRDNEASAGVGRMFLTSALIGAVIISLFAAALYFRMDQDPAAATQVAIRAGGTPGDRGDGHPTSGSNQAPPPNSQSSPEPAAVDYRSTPDARSAGSAPSLVPTQQAEAAPVQAISRPAPSAAALVTPAPSSAPTPGSAAAAFRGAEQLRQAAAGSWTIQVLVACQTATLERAFRQVNEPELRAVPVELKGQPCYRLCWGIYGDQAAASAALSSVPAYFAHDAQPKPVPIDRLFGR